MQPSNVINNLFREFDSTTRKGYICLDRNERIDLIPERFMQKVRESITSELITKYPDQAELKSNLAKTLGITKENVLLAPGSDNAIQSLFHAYLVPNDRVVMLDPSYAMYSVYAQMFQSEAIKIEITNNLTTNIAGIIEAIKQPRVKLAMLANPNQPTGTVIENKALQLILQEAERSGVLVAVDETYYDFYGVSILSCFHDYENIVIIRSFSKGAGLAGLRIGYVIGHPEEIRNMSKVQSCHNINSISLLCANLVLSHPDIIEDHVKNTKLGAKLLANRVMKIGLEPILPVVTNFMLIKFDPVSQLEKIVGGLKKKGYLVKGLFKYPCLRNFIRVTLGGESQMADFASALERTLEEQ